MYILVLILSFTSISLQDTYAFTENAYHNSQPDHVTADLFYKINYRIDQDTDTLTVTNSETETETETLDSESGTLDEMIYVYNLAAFSFIVSFLLALVLILLFYLFRIPQKQANGVTVLFSFLLLISCSSFFILDLFENGDFMETATPYVWIGSTSLAIHLLPYLLTLVFNLRRLKMLLHLTWFAAVPFILLYLEIDFHTQYMSGAAVFVAIILFYLLYRAKFKNESGVNHVITGTIVAFVLILLLIIDNYSDFQLQLSLYNQLLVVALLYIIIPFSLTLCLYFRQMTDYTVMVHELKELSSELKSANEKLAQFKSLIDEQEQFVSLGQLSLNISRDIKKPLNLVMNTSEVSIGLIEKAQNDLKNSPHFQNESGNQLYHLLMTIEEHLQKIQDQSAHAESKIKRVLKESDSKDKTMQLTDLNGLIEEYVSLAKRNMMNSTNPIKVGIELNLDKNVGSVPLIEKDFSRVILSLCKNAFDAMRIKMGVTDIKPEGQINSTGYSLKNYEPKLAIETKKEDRKISIKMEYNAPDVPDEVNHKNIQSIFEAKNHESLKGHGKSVIHDILKSHTSEMLIIPFGNGTSVYIELRV